MLLTAGHLSGPCGWILKLIDGDDLPTVGGASSRQVVLNCMNGKELSIGEHVSVHCSLMLEMDVMSLVLSSSCHCYFPVVTDCDLEL